MFVCLFLYFLFDKGGEKGCCGNFFDLFKQGQAGQGVNEDDCPMYVDGLLNICIKYGEEKG